MMSNGIRGFITGQSADLLIIVDPFKHSEAMNSKTIRDKVWDEQEFALPISLNKGVSVIAIMKH